jgi:hypothetical protein
MWRQSVSGKPHGVDPIKGAVRHLSCVFTRHDMVKVAKILCPLDFSDASNQAPGQALVIAGWYGAVDLRLPHEPGHMARALRGPVRETLTGGVACAG